MNKEITIFILNKNETEFSLLQLQSPPPDIKSLILNKATINKSDIKAVTSASSISGRNFYRIDLKDGSCYFTIHSSDDLASM